MKDVKTNGDWGIWIVIIPCILVSLGIILVLAWQMYPRITGHLNINRDASVLSFAPNTCQIKLENSALGITLTSTKQAGILRIHDGSFDTSSSTHVTFIQNEKNLPIVFSPNNCTSFDLKTDWRAASYYSDKINAVTGHLQLDCKNETLGHLTGTINFVSCPLEPGTSIL